MHLSDLEEKSEEEATFLLLAAGQPIYGNAAAQSGCIRAVVALSAPSDPPVLVLNLSYPTSLTLAPIVLPRFHKHLIPCTNSHSV